MVAEGYKDTEIGVIPIEWEAVELDDVSNTTRLAGYEYSEYWEEKEEGDILALKGYNIGKGKIVNRDTFYISNKLSEQLVRSKLFIGDVVFPVVGTIGNAVAITENDKYHINQNIAKITPNSKLNSNYLVQFLMSIQCRKEINRFNATTSQPNVLVGSLRKFRLPLPPLKEQEKIADILSTADDKIDAITSHIKKTETLKKGLLQKLLSEGIGHSEFKDSELGKIPLSWEVVELAHITDKITSGGTPSRKKAEYFENGTVNWIKTGELRDCYIYNSKEKITEEAIANSSAKVFPVDTLLIAMYGATIGRTAYLKTECSTNQACCAIIFNQGIADPYFYWKYFHFIKDDLISRGRGAGQPNISQSIIKMLLVPLPPLEEQKQIAEILSTADEKLEVLRAKKEKYETLKKGLLQKLLSGEVRV